MLRKTNLGFIVMLVMLLAFSASAIAQNNLDSFELYQQDEYAIERAMGVVSGVDFNRATIIIFDEYAVVQATAGPELVSLDIESQERFKDKVERNNIDLSLATVIIEGDGTIIINRPLPDDYSISSLEGHGLMSSLARTIPNPSTGAGSSWWFEGATTATTRSYVTGHTWYEVQFNNRSERNRVLESDVRRIGALGTSFRLRLFTTQPGFQTWTTTQLADSVDRVFIHFTTPGGGTNNFFDGFIRGR